MAASFRPTRRRLFAYSFVALLVWSSAPTFEWWCAGAAIVACGLALRVWATGYLHKNHRLTTQGPYAFIRHPLYAGTLICTAGLVVAASGSPGTADPVIAAMGAAGVAVYFLYYLPYKSRVEADRLVRRFGAAAEPYLRQVPNLLPVRAPYRGEPARWSVGRVLANNEQWNFLAVTAALAVIWLRGTLA
ncbi:MAG: hypothetical protein HYR85_00640 [Planctomycetes bacterium]|nr:hypothetical protein [Planctomycetota bacterium]MBI3847508.1 hypothetical protein [Planctomycetota bacterium]